MLEGIGSGGPVIPSFGSTSKCVLNNNLFCTSWFTSNWHKTFQPALIQHIELVAIAVGIGFAISFVLALVAHSHHKMAAPVTLLGSLLYTVPSLTAFEILVPITGITWTTAEIALIAYTILILFTNTLAGLSAVSPEVRDAAEGMGLTEAQIILRVDLPLALPTIIAGLRIATVSTVSLATVASYVVHSGLGVPIFNTLNNGVFKTTLIGAGGLAILLALFADAFLVVIERLITPWARARSMAR